MSRLNSKDKMRKAAKSRNLNALNVLSAVLLTFGALGERIAILA